MSLTAALPACGDADPAIDRAAEIDVVTSVFDQVPYPFVAVIDEPDGFAESPVEALGVDPRFIGIDWETEAAVVLAVPSNSCGRELRGFEAGGDDLTPVWEIPDECNSDDRSLNIVAVVGRSALIAGERLVLPAMPPFFNDDVAIPIDIDPPRGG